MCRAELRRDVNVVLRYTCDEYQGHIRAELFIYRSRMGMPLQEGIHAGELDEHVVPPGREHDVRVRVDRFHPTSRRVCTTRRGNQLPDSSS
jgi:hypothetical protein